MKKIYLLLAIFAIGLQAALGQTREITGTVTSAEDGSTLPGVSVSVKGTTLGTITDIDGKFLIKAPQNAQTLVFSFVGMQTKEVAVTGNIMNVQLEAELVGINEVVVTALGISREKKSLGYASQGVGSEEIMAANNLSPVSALSGKVAGLTISGQNFSGSQNILIRGASSFSQDNQPLFVVDGVPISNENFNEREAQRGGGGYDYGSMINDLNSYDIESIEVLKGSAASALYGSRGQNGVIMITTKKGKKGVKDFEVEVNSGVNFESVYILPKQQSSYGGGHVYDYDTGVYDNDGFSQATINGQTYDVVNYSMDESWGPKFDPSRQVLHWWGLADYEQGITSSPQTGAWIASPNDVKTFYETGISFQNSVNLTSSSEKSSIRIGYTNINLTGIVPNSSQNKNAFNINGGVNLFDNFVELSSNISFVKTETTGRPQFGYGDNAQSQKFFQWGQRQLDMKRLKNYMNPDGTQRVWNRRSVSNPAPLYSDNPYWTAYKNYEDDDRTRVYGKAGARVNFTDYLHASGTIYLDTYTFNQRERVAKGSQALSLYKEINRQAIETNFEGKIDFNKEFGDFNILAMIGGNIRKEDYSRFEGETSGGLVVDGLYNLNNSVNQAILDDFDREKEVRSYFGSVSVGYKGFAYLDATYRKDFDSSLPTTESSYSYPSVSASIILSELLEVSQINNLKFRANYGETGNGTSPYQVYNTYVIGTPFNGTPQFTNSIRLRNQNLKPEITKEIEFGLEGAFFKNRAGFDISWYNRNTENQIVPIEVSGTSGYTEKMINAGKIRNRGIEILAYGTPVKTEDFSWETSINFSKNNNKVLDLPEGLDKIQLINSPFNGAYLNAVQGKTFQELYGYDYIYDSEGNKVIDPNTGFYATTGELTDIGSVLPDYNLGFRNSFRYKSFDASALIDASVGGHYYSLTHMWSMYSGMARETAISTSNGNSIREDGIVLDGVLGDISYDDDGNVVVSNTKANDINLDGVMYGEYHYHGYGTPSATSIFDATYIKLREVTLGYTFPRFVDLIQSLRLSVYGRNLATWGLDNKGIDPETVVGGSGNIQGLEGGIIPATRSFGFNVRIVF
ncbi:MAG: SusC/RagA family TonB-linked outer membrane protein [Mangrovibacterium sp.]